MELRIHKFIKYLIPISVCVLIILFVNRKINNQTTKQDDVVVLGTNRSRVSEVYDFLRASERKVYSQNGEDGVIEGILNLLSMPGGKKYFVEIGTGPGEECNARYLREIKKWDGIQFDQAHSKPEINLNRVSLHHNNVLQLFEKYNVRAEIDLLSIDTDQADYWILEEILKQYKPIVVVHEINQQPPDVCVSIPKIDEIVIHMGSNFHGASICAFYCMAVKNDYTMVYCESAGVNCFWIRNDMIEKQLKLDPKLIQGKLNPKFLWIKPSFEYPETGKQWQHVEKCWK